MNISGLYKLEKKDINNCTESIAKAFINYPIFKYINGDKHCDESIMRYLSFVTKYSLLYGNAYASSTNFEGIILFTDSKDYKMNLVRSMRSGLFSLMKLGADAGRRFTEYDAFTMKTHKRIIEEPHQYLMLIGVNSEKQGQGYGSKLMLPILKAAEEKGQACYLETHDESNVGFYSKFGFKVASEDVVPGTDIIQFSMLRDK